MLQHAAASYKKVRATTSNQGELLLALYDGIFRFLNGSQLLIERGENTRARELNSRAAKVIAELDMALDHQAAPELCGNLAAIYDFCQSRLRHASRHDDAQAIADVLRALSPLREAWQLAVPKAMQEGVRFGPRGR
jgi:flagellar secretion chaperone FliS